MSRKTEIKADPAKSKGKSGFQPGESGNPAGRVKGVPNKATKEVKNLCRSWVEDAEYQKQFLTRFKAGKLPPQLETMVWAYAYGKPKESVELTGSLAETLQRVIANYGDAA